MRLQPRTTRIRRNNDTHRRRLGPWVTSGVHALAVISTLLLIATSSAPAHAHAGGGDVASGLVGGLLHPLTGADHVAAMVAVGLWGALLGAPALWLLPVAFPLVMAAGGVLGIAGVPLPRTEIGIALSAIVLGLMVMFAVRAPLVIAVTVVATFAIFHGYAHGAELPPGADAVAFSAGFVVATGLLHLAGIGLGYAGIELAARWPVGRAVVRLAGAAIAVAGVIFLRAAL
jgi:urease accessory protein